MKKLLIILLCTALVLCGCTDKNITDVADDGKLDIIATIFPPYDFVRSIGGDKVNLTMLIPPGTESHTYEPSPGDIISIEQCDIFIYAGGTGDVWVENIIDSIHSDTVFISLMDIVSPLTEQYTDGMQAAPHEHRTHNKNCDHNHEEIMPEYDEHVWTSPINADIICRHLTDTMCSIDPENSEYYNHNYSSYSQSLKKLDSNVRYTLDTAKRNTIIFADRFPIRYFTEEYGIEYFAAFPGCAAEVEPAPATLMFLIDKVQSDNIPAVFYRELSNRKVAQIVSEDTGAKMLQFHSCHSVTNDEFESGVTYLKLMEQNIDNLKEALN